VRSPPSPEAALQVSGLTKRYGDTVAVDAFSLEVARGQLVALLGPSGCGKTTTLRMIAGLVEPTSGSIVLEGRPVEGVPIHRRNIGMVFQQYALFPFLSVFDNVAYGLRERRVPKAEVKERVGKMLDLVGLTGLGDRRPRQLSGGQQQRVALARALVINPALLLLDEPLSNLDTKLRERVRGEIRDLQRRLDITTVFVTHDQDEALSIAHVVVVMRGGRIEQVGTPLEIYQRPANAFVADFIGACNLVHGEVLDVTPAQAADVTPAQAADVTPAQAADVTPAKAGVQSPSVARCRVGDTAVEVAASDLRRGDRVTLAIRPERLRIAPADGAPGALLGTVRNATYLGSRTSYEIDAAGATLRCDVQGELDPVATGTTVSLDWDEGAWRAFK
jgi:putative spermidine/putrescine transport system ATP-binding protein